jgi:uncharacterized damage-inducible protein DinB
VEGFAREYLWELDRVRKVTIATARLLPAAAMGFSAVGDMMTAAGILSHIVDVEDAMVDGVGGGKWTFGRPENKVADVDSFIRRSAEVRERTCRAVTEMGERGLWSQITAPFGYRGPALFLLDSIRENEVHHRGQLFVYLRILGIAPPWLYGEERKDEPPLLQNT